MPFSDVIRQRCNFSLVARYLLKFTRCSLLVVKSLVAPCKFSLYSLQKLLVAKNHSLLVAEIPSCKKSLVARCKICSSLVAEIARSKKYLVFRCEISSILIAKNHSLLEQSPAGIIVCLKSTKLGGSFSFFNIICFKGKKICCSSQHITLKSVVPRTLSNATIYKWVKTQQLLALSQRNEEDLLTKHPNCFSTCARWQIQN